MYLKSIKAQGFKSFADKLDLDIKDGITAIVGPNGSGKSNIVDAVRWVLGEQSVKSLRGSDNMTDVIFSGSKDRDMQSRAMVALTFDNSDKYFNSDFSEIEVKRVVYRTGENEYFINNTKVRLKDISNLFIDTGAGIESFNIISQGNISDIVNSKPENRRTIFEEAAGVLKYKKRKEESLRKLDRTKENLLRIGLVIDELATTVEPLKKESEIAQKFLSFKEELKDVEIALIVNDISSINNDYKVIRDELENLNQKVLDSESAVNTNGASIESLKSKIVDLDQLISETNSKLILCNENLSKLNADKQLMLERKKYDYSQDQVSQVIIALKDELLALEKELKLTLESIEEVKKDIEVTSKGKQELDNDLLNNRLNKSNISTKINNLIKENFNLDNKIDILENNIYSNARMPHAVQSILNNPRFTDVYGTISSLSEVDDKYALAFDIALGASSNFLVVKNNDVIKDAINYLKDNKLGRATFFPVDIIKPKYIDRDVLSRLDKVNGFVDVFSHLVSCAPEYRNIIDNQLGNVIVAKDIDSMNMIGRIIEYKYRVVSLDGDILHSGGSVSGGSNQKASLISEKTKLESYKYEREKNNKELDDLNNKLKIINSDDDILTNKVDEYQRKIISLNELLNQKKSRYNDLNNNYLEKKKSFEAQESLLDNKLDDEIDKILSNYSKVDIEKEQIEKELNKYKDSRFDLSNKLIEEENKLKNINSEYNKTLSSIKNKEIQLGKYDVKLDTLLLNLSENYQLTYEKASLDYSLNIPLDEARDKVSKLKVQIRNLGDVNVGAITEYQRLGERYEFLLKQQEDLNLASDELINVIDQMDKIMVDKFKEAFDKISNEFSVVFKRLFKGGKGILKLTDPDNILETGIDIIAEPPGKKLNSIGLLSGGEKTLTAISLLFAILNIKTVPFVILDEAEAALDEANVDTFGEYIKEKKNKSQFILITHKKRTMEYADVLYGITMQESGVSKIVSVKLDDK